MAEKKMEGIQNLYFLQVLQLTIYPVLGPLIDINYPTIKCNNLHRDCLSSEHTV